MAATEVAKGKVLINEGQKLDALHIVVSGSFSARFASGSIVLKKGDVIGLCDVAYDSHCFTYTALEDSAILSFPFKNASSIKDLSLSNIEIGKMMYVSMINQTIAMLFKYAALKDTCSDIYDSIDDYYKKYMDLCLKYGITARSLPQLELLRKLTLDEDLPEWMLGFYASYREFPFETKHKLAEYPAYLAGFMCRASEDVHFARSLCDSMYDYLSENTKIFVQENEVDIFDLYTSLLFRLNPMDSEKVFDLVEGLIEFLKEQEGLDKKLLTERVSAYRTKLQGRVLTGDGALQANSQNASASVSANELSGSLDRILEYSQVPEYEAGSFRQLLGRYKKLTDKSATDDESRKLRNILTESFNRIYASAFRVSMQEKVIPTVVKMFFNFGYMDEELAGAENAAYLYGIADTYHGEPSKGIYTAYEWLQAIYELKKDPSRNEFEVDYLAYLHDQRVQGKLTAELETQLAENPVERVNYELNNMFPIVNKISFGRISSFCPIFSEHNIIKPLPSCLVTPDSIADNIKRIEGIDYSAFYRETVYTNEEAGIPKEFINVRVLPDVILFPNIGTRGVMWQEIEGRKRTTPARFIISTFHLEDLPITFTRLVGEFRWELCKRVQGARWNDVSDRSLTSEYFDYIQFYRKNSELSQDAKEKIKQGLIKAKNSFKEMFVRDYIIWVLFEGNGSPRLNKLVRGMLCTYCPFPYELRLKMSGNPLFKEYLERYDVKAKQKIHHFENVQQKIKSSGSPVPREILENISFVKGTIQHKY